jgi:hypothetical protein
MQRLILALTIAVLVEVTGVPSALAQQASAASVRVTDFGFLSNDGLLAGDARLFTTDANAVIGLTSDGGSIAIGEGKQTLRWRFEGADPHPQMIGRDPLPGEVNFLHASDPSQWRTAMQSFARVVYSNLYPSIDHGVTRAGGGLQLDFEVAPGGDPSRIALTFDAATALAGDGTLVLTLPQGPVVVSAPKAWQGEGESQTPVSIEYRVTESGAVGFALGPYDTKQTLFIDPIIDWRTALLGSAARWTTVPGKLVNVDRGGYYYIAGQTITGRVFVVKYDATGARVLFTVLGAGNPTGLDVDASGNMYLAGVTRGGWIVVGPSSYEGWDDGFVAKVDRSGTWLHYSQYINGNRDESVAGIVVGPENDACVFGHTRSANFKSFYDGSFFNGPLDGPSDLFFMRLTPRGGPKMIVTFGGSGDELALAIAKDDAGHVYVAGVNDVDDFPTTPGAYRERGSGEGFLAKLSRIRSSDDIEPIWATMLPGMTPFAVAVQPGTGVPYVTGVTISPAFETTPDAFRKYFTRHGPDGGLLESRDGWPEVCDKFEGYPCFDTVVMKLAADGSRVDYATFLGDARNDAPAGIAVDASGRAYVVGDVEDLRPGEMSLFPVTPDAIQPANAGMWDAFLTVFDPTGSSVVFSTFLGTAGQEVGLAVDLDGPNVVMGVSGATLSLVRIVP